MLKGGDSVGAQSTSCWALTFKPTPPGSVRKLRGVDSREHHSSPPQEMELVAEGAIQLEMFNLTSPIRQTVYSVWPSEFLINGRALTNIFLGFSEQGSL